MGEVLTADALLGGTPTDLAKPPAGTLTVTQEGAEWAAAGTRFSPAFIGRAANNLIARNENVPQGTAVDVAAFSSRI